MPRPLVFSGNDLPAAETVVNIEEAPEINRADSWRFLGAEADKLEGVLAYSPLLLAIKGSKQWQFERARDKLAASSSSPSQAGPARTACIIAIRQDPNNDLSFMIRTSYEAGWSIVQYLNFDDSARVPGAHGGVTST